MSMKNDTKYQYYRDRRATLREQAEASGIRKTPTKTPAERKREQRARETAKSTQAASEPQISTSRAPNIAVQHEPMDVDAAATDLTSGPSGSG